MARNETRSQFLRPGATQKGLARRILVGSLTGFLLGAVIGAILWSLNTPGDPWTVLDFDSPYWFQKVFGYEGFLSYCGVMALGMAFTGMVIGWCGTMPEVVGLAAGVSVMLVAAFIIGANSGGFLGFLILVFVLAGAVLGPITGLAIRLVDRLLP